MSDANLQDGWVKIGEVGVDSGVIRIGDTHYVGKMETDETASWNEVTHKETWFGMCPGVDVRSGHGDGCYDVLAQMEEIDGYMTVTRVMIDFESESAGSTTAEENDAAGRAHLGDPEC